jgi:hypothetical protein
VQKKSRIGSKAKHKLIQWLLARQPVLGTPANFFADFVDKYWL